MTNDLKLEMLSHIVEHFPFPILLVSKTGEIVYANLFSSNLFGYEPQELIGRNFTELTSPSFQGTDSSIFSEFETSKTFISTVEKKIIHKLGQEVWVKQTIVPIKFDSDTYNYLLVVMENISFQKAKQEFINSTEELFNDFFYNNNAIKLLIDPSDGSIVEANQSACEFYGYSKEKISQMKIFEINTMTNEQIKFEMEKAEQRKQNYFHFPHRLANGEIRIVEVHTGPVQLRNKTYLLSIIHDITNQYHIIESTQTKIESNFLLNRIRLIQSINNLLNWTQKDLNYAFIWIDVDHFSHFKIRYTRETLQNLSMNIIERIKNKFPTIVYQLAEDEFGILVEVSKEIKNLLNVIKSLFQVFSLPFDLGKEKISLTASFGICLIQDKKLEAKKIYEYANNALLEAKLRGRNTFFVHNSEIDSLLKKQLQIEKILKEEIEKDKFDLFLQPILKDSFIYGIICKPRWHNSKLEEFYPNQIASFLEDFGIFADYYFHFLRKIYSQILEWQQENFQTHLVFISIFQSNDYQVYIDTFSKIINDSNILPHYFVLDFNYDSKEEFFNSKIVELKKIGFKTCCTLNEISFSLLQNLENWDLDYIRIDLKTLNFGKFKKKSLLNFISEFFKDSIRKIIIDNVNTHHEQEELSALNFKLLTGEYFGTTYSTNNFLPECLIKGFSFHDES